ncbi:MAG: hypothetical protein ABJA50_11050 [Chloroflexota bacterium]
MAVLSRNWQRIIIWAVALGLITTLIADWGEWDKFAMGLAWRGLIAAVGGVAGLLLNYFFGHYITMGTNVIESMGITTFSNDKHQKIENGFVFMGALVGAILAMIFVR